MPPLRDRHGRFAKAPLRAAGEAWASQVRAAEVAAGRNGVHLHARLAQQQHDRALRTSLVKRQRCEAELRHHAPGRDGERRLFCLPFSVPFPLQDDALVGKAPETFEAIFVVANGGVGRWRPLIDGLDRDNALRHERKVNERRRIRGDFGIGNLNPDGLRLPREDRGPFARALSDEMRRGRQDIRGLAPILGRAGDLVIQDDPIRAKINLKAYEPEPESLVKVEPWEARPEDRPYDWWKRLPFCDDDALSAALDRAVRRAHPHWKRTYYSNEFRLALLGGGSFRDCFHVLTADGYDTSLIVKRPTRSNRHKVRQGTCDLAYDQGNGQEAAVYLHLADVAPDALACFPVLYETEPVYGDWAIHEKVRPECRGKEALEDLEGRWRSAGVNSGDLHGGNIGRRDSDRCTLVIDWGHFTIKDFHSVGHRARF